MVSDDTNECIIIDCGVSSASEKERLSAYIEKKGLQPVMAVNTHGHIDHIAGVGYVKEKYAVPFAMHAADEFLLERAAEQAQLFGFDADFAVPKIDIDLSQTGEIRFGDSVLQVIHTPGHSPGHVSLYGPEEKILFTGDTVFQGSIGRTDLPGGDYDVIMRSILTKILPLGGDVTIYPGHGNHSTLGHEAMYNPFIREVLEGSVNKPCDE